jgi:putative oxidoreductase
MHHNEGRASQFNTFSSVAFLTGRLIAALAFMSLSIGQTLHFADASRSAGALGMLAPQFFVAAEIVFQAAGSIMLAIGYRARFGAALLAISLVPSIWLFADAAANRLYLAGALAALGGLLPYIALGAGPYCLDSVYRSIQGE